MFLPSVFQKEVLALTGPVFLLISGRFCFPQPSCRLRLIPHHIISHQALFQDLSLLLLQELSRCLAQLPWTQDLFQGTSVQVTIISSEDRVCPLLFWRLRA